jgi:3-hydroxyacyl-CoA dehydrogenase
MRDSAVAFARKIAGVRPLPRVRDKTVTAEPGVFDAVRKSIARKARNQKAPYHCIAAVEAACTLPFDDGIRREAELFAELESSDEAKALRYAFFAEREVAKLPDLPAKVSAYEFTEALDRGMERIRSNYATSVKRGSLSDDEMQRRLARIHPVAGYEDIADSDVVIEAVFERMDVKIPIFEKLDGVLRPGAFLFSNTSALDMDELASVTQRPEYVAGTHFFSPANVMKLLEVVRPSKASPETLLTAMALGRRIGKISAMAGNTDGFVANRSRAPFNSEMVILLEEGCVPEQVDKVMVDFGYPMGPFAVGDLAGLDIGAEGRKRRALANPTSWWSWGGTGRRRMPAGTVTRRAIAPRIPIQKSPRLSNRWPPRWGFRKGRSAIPRFCNGFCSHLSTKPVASWRRERPTGQATSMSCGCTVSASRAIAAA